MINATNGNFLPDYYSHFPPTSCPPFPFPFPFPWIQSMLPFPWDSHRTQETHGNSRIMHTSNYKKLSYRRHSEGRRFRSFKIIDVATNRKRIRDFASVNITNLHPVFHRLQVIADYWSFFLLSIGVLLFDTFLRGEPLNSTIRFGIRKLETSLYRMARNVFRYLELCRRGS